MKGLRAAFHAAGQPLELREIDVPRPGPGELLVRVACTTLCRSDLHTHSGRRTEPTPCVLGHEIVGHIAAFGAGTAPVDAAGQPSALGDRITWSVVAACGDCLLCGRGVPQKCLHGFKYGHVPITPERPLGGGLAEYVVLVPRTAWYRVPESLPDGIAAMANCAGATAAAVVGRAETLLGTLTAGNFLILGAGILGLIAAGMLQARGAATVVVSDPQAAAQERALRFGASAACSEYPQAINGALRAAGAAHGADAVLELSGSLAAVRSGLSEVRTGGAVVLAGTVSPIGTVALDPEQCVRRMVTVSGVHNYRPDDLQAALTYLAEANERYPLTELVSESFPLAAVEQAFAAAYARPGVRVAVCPSGSAFEDERAGDEG